MPRHHSQMDPDNLTPEHITTTPHEIRVRPTESINKTIIEYDIVTASTLHGHELHTDGLIALVNVKINEGWSPIGGLTWGGGYSLYQAIVKYG
jgi:hypothetical protein